MSMIGYGNACIVKGKAEIEYRLLKEKIAWILEENRSALRLRKQAGEMSNMFKSLHNTVDDLYVLSQDESSYITLPQLDKTLIEIAFDMLQKELQQSLDDLKDRPGRGSYVEIHDALSYVLKEAPTICDMIHRHSNPEQRSRWGSNRIESFVHSYDLKIKGDYLH